MRLFIELSKGGKQGLIPVKKQVSKKGKVFTQTFYVKPGEDPVVVKAPKAETKKVENRPVDKVSKRWNMPDGFYVLTQGASFDYRVRISDSDIFKIINFRGREFYIARGLAGDADKGTLILNNFRAYDPKSGYAVAPSGSSVEDAENIMKKKLSNISDESFYGKLDNAKPIKSIKRVYTKKLEVEDSFGHIESYEDAAKKVLEYQSEKSGVDSKIPLGEVATWLHGQVATNRDLRWMIEDMDDITNDMFVYAVKNNMSFDNVRDREKTIDGILSHVSNSRSVDGAIITNIDREDIEAWAKKFNVNLVHGIDFNSLQINDEDDQFYVPGSRIVAYAVSEGISIGESYDHFNEMISEQQDEVESFVDSSGNHWGNNDMQMLGDWVDGNVKSKRNDAKDMFRMRENGNDMVGTFANVLEQHATKFTGKLYRGTFNKEWGNTKPGDVFQFGLGSFSLVESNARNFTNSHGDGTILIMDSSEFESPVVGVNVNQLADEAEEAGAGSAIQKYRISSYRDENEFIVLAPSLEIISVKKDTEYGNLYTIVHVKPIKTDLIRLMKAQFESRGILMEMIERTFDYPLHREPEGVWS